jgi:hypothetical protein
MSWEDGLKKMAMNNDSFFVNLLAWLQNPETKRDKLYNAIDKNYELSLTMPEHKRAFRKAIQILIEFHEDNPFSATQMGRKGGN